MQTIERVNATNPKYVGLTGSFLFSTSDIEKVWTCLSSHPTYGYAEVYRLNSEDEVKVIKRFLVSNRQYAYGTGNIEAFKIPHEDVFLTIPNAVQYNILGTPYVYQSSPNRGQSNAGRSNYLQPGNCYQQLGADNMYPTNLPSLGIFSCVADNAYAVCTELDQAISFLKDVDMLYPVLKLYPSIEIAHRKCQEQYMWRYFAHFRRDTPQRYSDTYVGGAYVNDNYAIQIKKEEDNGCRQQLIGNGILMGY